MIDSGDSGLFTFYTHIVRGPLRGRDRTILSFTWRHRHRLQGTD